MLRLAHRGDWRRAPENTIPALLAGLKVPGCDGLEFDVRLSAVGVPSLADVLAALPHRAFLDVELKAGHDRAVVEVLAAGRGPGLVNAVVSSFEPDTLERIGGLAPAWPRWLNARDLS